MGKAALPISARRCSLIAGICGLLLSQPIFADDVIPAELLLGGMAAYLPVTIGIGAICGYVSAARGLPPWRILRYLWAGIFLLIFGFDLSSEYIDVFPLLRALMETGVFAVPITLSALLFHARRSQRTNAASPTSRPLSISRRRIVIEAGLLLVAVAMTVVIMFRKQDLPDRRWQAMCDNFAIDGLQLIAAAEPTVEMTIRRKHNAYFFLSYVELVDAHGNQITSGNDYTLSPPAPATDAKARVKLKQPIGATPTFVDVKLCETDASPRNPCAVWAFGRTDKERDAERYCAPPPPLPANFMN